MQDYRFFLKKFFPELFAAIEMSEVGFYLCGPEAYIQALVTVSFLKMQGSIRQGQVIEIALLLPENHRMKIMYLVKRFTFQRRMNT